MGFMHSFKLATKKYGVSVSFLSYMESVSYVCLFIGWNENWEDLSCRQMIPLQNIT
jgi:hypothetical protein